MPHKWRTFIFFLSVLVGSTILINFVIARAQNAYYPSIKMGIFYPPSATPSPSRTPTPTIATQQPPFSPPRYSINTVLEQLVYFSQRDPDWARYPGYFPNIITCGCGPTTIAQILAGYKDTTGSPRTGVFNPPGVWNLVTNLGERTGSICGVEIGFLRDALSTNGFQVQLLRLSTTNRYLVEEEFARFIDAGYYVVAMVQINGIGHYTLITDKTPEGIPLVYDAYYGYNKSTHPLPIEQHRVYLPYYAFLLVKK